MKTPPPSTSQLLGLEDSFRDFREGSPQALAQLLQHEEPVLHDFLMHMSGHIERIQQCHDDLASAFLPHSNPPETYDEWRSALYRTARNFCADIWGAQGIFLPIPGCPPRSEDLLRTLRGLDPTARELLLLRARVNMTVDQIAVVVGLSPSQVREMLTLASERMTRLLGTTVAELDSAVRNLPPYLPPGPPTFHTTDLSRLVSGVRKAGSQSGLRRTGLLAIAVLILIALIGLFLYTRKASARDGASAAPLGRCPTIALE